MTSNDDEVRRFAASLPPSVSASITCHIWPVVDHSPERDRFAGVRWVMEGDECDTYGNAGSVNEAIRAMRDLIDPEREDNDE